MEKTVTQKIQEILNEEDQKIFESAVEKSINDKVTKEVAIKVEESKKKLDSLAEEYVSKEVASRLETEKAKLVEEYDSKLESLEKKIVSKVDSFIEHVIMEQISDASIEKLAINEVFKPVVEGIQKVYSENFIVLESDSSKKINESDKKVKELQTQLSESMAKLMESEERLEKTATFLLISEKCDGLTKTQKERVVSFFKSKAFDEVNENIETVLEMVKNDSEKKTIEEKATPKTDKKVIDSILTEGDAIKKDKKNVAKVQDVLTEDLVSIAQVANNFL